MANHPKEGGGEPPLKEEDVAEGRGGREERTQHPTRPPNTTSHVRQGRGWKLFMMLPLLHRPPRGGLVSRDKLVRRFDMFSRGERFAPIQSSAACSSQAAVGRRRRRRRPGDDLERRAARAEMFVHLGELSSARQALEGASVAPGSNQTLGMLSDPAKRPPILRDPIPEEVTRHVPSSPFEMDEHRFLRNLPSARRGAAGAPSGMTVEHLRILLDNTRDSKMFFRVCENLAQGKVPDSISPSWQDDSFAQARWRCARHRCRRRDSPTCPSHHRSAAGKDS